VNQDLIVLLVDDCADDRYFFRRALARAELQVRLFEVEDGVEALDYLNQEGRFSNASAFPRPRFIFLDLNMPGRNGFEVLRWLSGQPYRDQIRVIICSGSDEPHDRELAMSLGANGYMVKPATPQKIQQQLAESD